VRRTLSARDPLGGDQSSPTVYCVTAMEESPGAKAARRVEGKVAIVTGAGQVDGPGIGTGKAAAILLARHGARVVLVGRDRERLARTHREIDQTGGTALAVAGDVTKRAGCERVTHAALDAFGRLDVLVNNVGLSAPGTVVDAGEETWHEMLDINLTSVYLMCKYAVPATAATGGGSIVNVSSVGALRSIGFAPYSAAKGALHSLSREMAAQHGPLGIRVNVVAPGSVETPALQVATTKIGTDMDAVARRARAALPLGRTTRGTGWDIGYAVLFFASDESSWVSGQVLTVDGGQCATAAAVVLADLEMERT
jgi:NAD(P)-dependent dehydrogenase (short-subunit alcohol dehydrogenase family)